MTKVKLTAKQARDLTILQEAAERAYADMVPYERRAMLAQQQLQQCARDVVEASGENFNDSRWTLKEEGEDVFLTKVKDDDQEDRKDPEG